MEWIKVVDRLPDDELERVLKEYPGEKEIEVIVHIEGADEATALYYDGSSEHGNCFYSEVPVKHGYHRRFYPVDMWTRFPEVPKER